jgi:Sulfotransferase family
MAGMKRLVIKNPFGLARVDMLKTMFPEALFVFALRAPWPTIQSATIKGNGAYIVPTEFVNSLPDDHILRAAATWAEAIDVLTKERNANWHVVRYEELVTGPHVVISELYRRAGPHQGSDGSRRYMLAGSKSKGFLFDEVPDDEAFVPRRCSRSLEGRAKAFGYSADLSELRGNVARYALQTCFTRLRKLRKRIARPRHALSANVLDPILEIERHRNAA